MEKTFKQRYLDGECGIDSIDDCIEAWHNSEDDGISLPEYLGLTDEEYYLFVDSEDEFKNHLDHLKEAAK